MKALSHILSLSLLLGAAAAFQAPAARAQSAAPNPSPTIITSAPYTISSPGYYQLGANLTVTNTSGAIITISAGNVILDFGGHFISGPANSATTSTIFGVETNENADITIQNGTIANCYEGIGFFGNSSTTTKNINQTVRNMLIKTCSHVGINFQNALYSRAVDNVVTNTGGATAQNGTGNYAFYLQGNNITLTHNVIATVTGPSSDSSNAYGVFDNSSASAILVGNQVFNAPTAFDLESSNTKYQDNLTSGCTNTFTGNGTDAGGNN